MKIMMVTGAGVNESCGLSVYNPELGRYVATMPRSGVEIEKGITPELLVKNPVEFWRNWRDYCLKHEAAAPGPAHEAVRRIADLASGFVEVTQNLDQIPFHGEPGVHWRIMLHGRLDEYCCKHCNSRFSMSVSEDMSIPPKFELAKILSTRQLENSKGDCSVYHAAVQPNNSWMEGGISTAKCSEAMEQAEQCDLLIICGAKIYDYVARYTEAALNNGAQVLNIDPGASPFEKRLMMSGQDMESLSRILCVRGRPDEVMPALRDFLFAQKLQSFKYSSKPYVDKAALSAWASVYGAPAAA